MATHITALDCALPCFILAGCWALVHHLAVLATNTHRALGTMGLGIVLIAFGVAWYLFSINWLFSLALILLILGALAIVARREIEQSLSSNIFLSIVQSVCRGKYLGRGNNRSGTCTTDAQK